MRKKKTKIYIYTYIHTYIHTYIYNQVGFVFDAQQAEWEMMLQRFLSVKNKYGPDFVQALVSTLKGSVEVQWLLKQVSVDTVLGLF